MATSLTLLDLCEYANMLVQTIKTFKTQRQCWDFSEIVEDFRIDCSLVKLGWRHYYYVQFSLNYQLAILS